MKSGNLNFLEPSGPLQACNCFTFTLTGGAADRWQGHRSEAISVHCTKSVYTVKTCCWRWVSLSPETCRAD